MVGRNGGESYRYGLNGMEQDDEVKGRGNSYSTYFRSYDSRLGKWLSTDPLSVKFPWQSPYAAFDNNPIFYSDPSGSESESIHLDKDGNFLAEYDDGDDNIYIHDIEASDYSPPSDLAIKAGVGLLRAEDGNLLGSYEELLSATYSVTDLVETYSDYDPNDSPRAIYYPDNHLANNYPMSYIVQYAGAAIEDGVFSWTHDVAATAHVVLNDEASIGEKFESVSLTAVVIVVAHIGGKKGGKMSHLKDFSTKNTINRSALCKSERAARNLARGKIGKNPVKVEANKFRSADGKWQYRAKSGDLKGHGAGDSPHIHIEKINPKTGEVLENWHLRW